MMHGWKRKRLENGIEQYMYVDEDLDEELMMLPTDIVLLEDPKFRVWVKCYARDKEPILCRFCKRVCKVDGTGNSAGRGWEDYEHGQQERRVSVRAKKSP
jgi:catalase (peroxidase I)